MKTQISNTPEFNISHQQVRDIEEHCRKVHSEAVVHAFHLLISVPAELFRKLFMTNRGDQASFNKTKSFDELPLS